MIRYAITDPKFFSPPFFEKLHKMARKPNFILFRDVVNPDYENLAKSFVQDASLLAFDRVLLHADWELALRLGAGVHLRSTQMQMIRYAKQNGVFTVVSTHSLFEAHEAQRHGADMITLSPVFEVPNKGEPLGLQRFAQMLRQIDIPVIALGGIVSQERIKQVVQAGAVGFASIRYFFSDGVS